MAYDGAPLPGSPVMRELSGLRGELLRLWKPSHGGASDASTSEAGSESPGETARLRGLLSEREADLQHAKGALEEARRSEEVLRARLERVEAELRTAELQLAEAARVAASIRLWFQQLQPGRLSADGRAKEHSPPQQCTAAANALRPDSSVTAAGFDELRALTQRLSHPRAREEGTSPAPAASGPLLTAELDDLEQQMFAIANQNEALEKGMLNLPKAERRSSLNPLLTAELDELELQMFAISSQNQALEKEMRRAEDDQPQMPPSISCKGGKIIQGAHADFDDPALAAFRVACCNFSQRARTLAGKS
mmetsp:Transcript_105317/g.307867  ORF Transcript_105317/g.307867 Transcript_105317/m.307867 type:complete len:308 (-) Transcript_105317:54-977(-)